MATKKDSPEITKAKWGTVETSDGSSYKDAKLYPGGSRAWDWNETGTHHVPGIQPADVEELIENGARTIVLSKGFNERLQTCKETKEYLDDNDIDFYILETEKAVQKYNSLRKNQAVGALIHSTC